MLNLCYDITSYFKEMPFGALTFRLTLRTMLTSFDVPFLPQVGYCGSFRMLKEHLLNGIYCGCFGCIKLAF